jgi:isoleucyl-tRNA synthetase
LPALLVDEKYKLVLTPVEGLIREELNVKTIEYISAPDAYVSYIVKPNFPVLGPKFGKLMRGIGAELANGDAATFVKTLRKTGELQLTVEGTPVTLTNDDVEVRVEEKEGFAAEMGREHYLIMDIRITPELVQEGLAREIISKVQNMRKNAGLELTDRIALEIATDAEVNEAVNHFKSYIMDETLAVGIESRNEAGEAFEAWDINGHPAQIKIAKA